jgi:hypothetical protein
VRTADHSALMPNTTKVPPAAVADLAAKFKQWTVGSDAPGDVLPKSRFGDHPERSYNLKNRAPRKFLQYEEQDFGINLGWTNDAEPATAKRVARWFFATSTGGDRPVRYGDKIALANGTGDSFLHYADRSWGINLDWSRTPVFEWQLLGGSAGQPVHRSDYLAIYNLKTKNFWLYFDRNVGGDIGWDDSKRWGTQLGDKAEQLLKEYGEEALKAAVLAALSA